MLKNIMVHVDSSSSCQNRIEASVALAKKHGAVLTGLHVYSSPRLKEPSQQLVKVRSMFEQMTADCGVTTEFIEADFGYLHTGVAEMVGYYASFADLLVVSQPLNAKRDKRHEMISSPERLLLGTGCPVLVVPRDGATKPIGERVMVAWKAGPKASRATHDAMPLLTNANSVTMASVGEATFRLDEGTRLLSYLALHGVSANIERIPASDLSIGDTLLNLVADCNVDLMVFGVHIVSKRGQLDMGELGNYLLDNMTVPMLLSH